MDYANMLVERRVFSNILSGPNPPAYPTLHSISKGIKGVSIPSPPELLYKLKSKRGKEKIKWIMLICL